MTNGKYKYGIEHVIMIQCIVLAGVLSFVLGTATTTLSVSGPGFLGQSYTITCDTSGTISTGINVQRPDGISVVGCNPSGVCVSNTGYSTSVNKTQYTIHIDSLEEHDAGTWKCTDGASNSMAKGPSLTIVSPLNEMTCSISQHDSSTLTFHLESYYCSINTSPRFQLVSSSELSCNVENVVTSSDMGLENVTGTCGITNKWSGMVNPVFFCGGHKFTKLTCQLDLDTVTPGSVSRGIPLTASKVCVGLYLLAVRLILYVR